MVAVPSSYSKTEKLLIKYGFKIVIYANQTVERLIQQWLI